MTSKLAAAFAISVLPSLAAAEPIDNVLVGAGTTSCGQYLEKSDDQVFSALYVTWVQGFLSGFNLANRARSGRSAVALPDMASIKAYMDKYCRDNPLGSPAVGAAALFNELEGRNTALP